ncbi:hypothetical protein [Catenulispora subtropica]|uniref:WD40 domain protein beta Propeller n=1 Tax=Catenulispora subtropica TaxID=450798 RepID=A0ABN2QIP6_9ACTN
MAGRGKRQWAKAAVCAAALVTPLTVSGCASQGGTGNPLGLAGTSSATKGGDSSATGGDTAGGTTAPVAESSASSSASSASGTRNGTGGTKLTVSDGSSKILMNGKAVDFGTAVYDQSWSPDGKKVAFIDDHDNLWVANADGSGKVEAAKNSTGEKWTHPAWQVAKADTQDGVPARNNIFFASTAGDGTLWKVVATAHDGKPEKLELAGTAGENEVDPPQTRNMWPSAAGDFGGAIYEHDNGSSSDIWVRDDFLRQQGDLAFKNGSEPSYAIVGGSANSDPTPEVVFVRTVNGHRHIFFSVLYTANGDAPKAKDLTPNAAGDYVTPALSPDGKTVAYSTESGVYLISTDGSGTPKQITDKPGFPAFRAGS